MKKFLIIGALFLSACTQQITVDLPLTQSGSVSSAHSSAPSSAISSSSSSTAVSSYLNWKTYDNTEAGVSFKYPSGWKQERQPNTDVPFNVDNLSGSEGKVEIVFPGQGGACGDENGMKDLEKITLNGQTFDVCHTLIGNVESWDMISGIGFTLNLSANAPASKNSPVIKKILATLTVKK